MNLIRIADEAKRNAEFYSSKITKEIIELSGMSSQKVRHFLNNLCNFEECNYLEVGVWKGSTLISALYGNKYHSAFAIDDFSEFGQVENEFTNNVNKYKIGFTFIQKDFLLVDANLIKNINVFFYDGAHDEDSQFLSLVKFYNSLSDNFIFVVDDWNHEPAKIGTLKAISRLKLRIVHNFDLFASFNGDTENYWNGLGVFVLQK